MKVAICHDYLNQWGGAERVLETLMEMFPDADIYTLLHDEKKIRGKFTGRIAGAGFLNTPLIARHHRAFIPLLPLAASRIKAQKTYDLVISSSAGYAKGFNIQAKHHICYCHTPLRYAWESGYIDELPRVPSIFKIAARPIAAYMRYWDKSTAQRPDVIIANSHFIAGKIKKYYGRDAEVIYPPVDSTKFFYKKPTQAPSYLMVGRLLHYKKFDLGIRACMSLERHLKIIGTGPQIKSLKQVADPTYIEFLEKVTDEELQKHYRGARALIFPQVEDLGLVAAEAQTCGTPVIAFNQGGATEIVRDGKTGILFNEQSPEAVVSAIKKFEDTNFNRKLIAEASLRFSKETFKDKIKACIERACARN
jgi:glycosyltransferase involved in cell wall biosynthesis